MDEWDEHPPVHLLVRSYLGYRNTAPKRLEAVEAPEPESSSQQNLTSLMQQGLGAAIPGPQAARDAATPEEALAAFERHFFGDVKNVEQL